MDPDEGDKGSEESYDLSEVEDQMVPQEEDTLDPLPATEEEESMDPWTIPEHVSRLSDEDFDKEIAKLGFSGKIRFFGLWCP